MSITISNGGGGGGITIESDPTALKIASNLADLNNPSAARDNLGLGSTNAVYFNGVEVVGGFVANNGSSAIQVTPTEITFPDGSTQSTAGGGSTTELYLSGYSTEFVSNSVSLKTQNSSYNGSVEISTETGQGATLACSQADGYGYRHAGLFCGTDGLGASLKYGYNVTAGQWGWQVDAPIIFADGTAQNTAYTGGGGGGGGVATQQRLADAIAALVATPVVFWGAFGVTINLQWAFTSAYNSNSLYYEYPKFIDLMSGWGYPNTYTYTPYAYTANEYFGMSYVDYNGMVFISLNNIQQWFTDAITIVVTDNVNGGGYLDTTTTAYSFPCAIATYNPA